MTKIPKTEPVKETICSAWRDAVYRACTGVQDEGIMEAVWGALNDPCTPDAVGEALLEQVRMVAAQGGTMNGRMYI